jgi:hypothetical protein
LYNDNVNNVIESLICLKSNGLNKFKYQKKKNQYQNKRLPNIDAIVLGQLIVFWLNCVKL